MNKLFNPLLNVAPGEYVQRAVPGVVLEAAVHELAVRFAEVLLGDVQRVQHVGADLHVPALARREERRLAAGLRELRALAGEHVHDGARRARVPETLRPGGSVHGERANFYKARSPLYRSR